MIKEIQYTSIRRVLDNLLDHPLLRDVSLEQAVRYTIRFIQLNGFPKFYKDKVAQVEIKDFRGLMPCDLVSIIQVKDIDTGICLRSMTDNFPMATEPDRPKPDRPKDLLNNVKGSHKKFNNVTEAYLPPDRRCDEELAFKTQGRVIFTTFPEGCVEIAYKAIPTDDDGFPLLIDNENYLAALEAFIKVQVFTIKFDTGKLNANVLMNAQTEYAWRAAELQSEFQQPSVSEMQTLTNIYNTLLTPMREFDKGFKHTGDREYLRRH